MALFHSPRPAVPIRGVHLDLKGLPPTPRRFLQWLDIIAAARLNCVLVEWEDMYPWTRFPELRCATAYSPRAVAQFLDRAAELKIQVIPLVQSFGHMENVLGKQRFRAMRELPASPADLCPSHQDAHNLVWAMVDDVMRTHRGRITHFHLGGDEVWSLGSCPRCRRVVQRDGKAALYLQHIVPLLQRLKVCGVQPILWDDMMRHWPKADLRELGRLTDLMPWSYGDEPFARVTPEMLRRFHDAGITLWGGGAFKGADGVHVDVANLDSRLTNMTAWAAGAKRHRLAGVVATGWSRYSTCRVPCEGMEASLDALLLAGAALWDGKLPADATAQADALLRRRLKRLAGPRFVRCRDSSRKLNDWWKRFPRLLDETRALAFLAGEIERRDDLALKRLCDSWRAYLAEGRRLGRAWQGAHAGLVPALWTKHYIASRLWLPEAVGRTLAQHAPRKHAS
jgi:hexosaminidase